MKIIIVGMGQTGSMLAAEISKGNHDVVIIDENKSVINKMTDQYSVSGICGSGASKQVLLSAGADTADVVIAVTPIDEINLMICQVAKKCGTIYAAARITKPEFSKDKAYIEKEFQIDYIVNSKRDAALEIARHIGLPGHVKAEGFFNRLATIIRLHVDEDSALNGKSVKDVRTYFDTDMIIGTIVREGKVLIPDGKDVLQAGDDIEVIAPNASISAILMKLQLVQKPAKKILVVGGGTIAEYLAEELDKEKKKIKILDSDQAHCVELAAKLSSVEVVCGDGLDEQTLHEEGIDDVDVCISLTSQDENNLVISLFAWSCGVDSVIAKVDSPVYEKLLNKVNIQTTISPAFISVQRFIAFIRNVTVYNDEGNDIRRFFQIADGTAQAIEFIVYDNYAKKGVALKDADFKLKKDLIIAAIIRDEKVMIPDGNSVIAPGDRVVVITKNNSGLNVMNDVFCN